MKLILLLHFSSNQGLPSNNDASQKPDSSPNTIAGTQQTPKQGQNSTHSPANDAGNPVPINQSSGGLPLSKGKSTRYNDLPCHYAFTLCICVTWRTFSVISFPSSMHYKNHQELH